KRLRPQRLRHSRVEPPDIGSAARFYIGRLDARVSQALRPQPLPYLYMSLMIEERATWAYRIYQSVLAEQSCGMSLAALLAEENMHLDAMAAEIHRRDRMSDQRVEQFRAIEFAEFGRFWNAVEVARRESAREAAE